jgi:hypothetical protein
MRLAVAAALFAFALTPQGSAAATFTRAGMCDDFRLVKRGVDLVIVCPTWQPTDWLIIVDIYLRCAKVSASRTGRMLNIVCDGSKPRSGWR